MIKEDSLLFYVIKLKKIKLLWEERTENKKEQLKNNKNVSAKLEKQQSKKIAIGKERTTNKKIS